MSAQDVPPEVVERMIEVIRGVADCPIYRGSGWAKVNPELYDEAVSLVRILPKPVDPDLLEAQHFAELAEGDFVTPHRPARLERLTTHIYAAIKRGRELARLTEAQP